MVKVNVEVKNVIPTAVLLIRTIQAVLVSIAHSGEGNTAMLRAQEVVWRACCDSTVC